MNRPQNDGPAERATTLILYAKQSGADLKTSKDTHGGMILNTDR